MQVSQQKKNNPYFYLILLKILFITIACRCGKENYSTGHNHPTAAHLQLTSDKASLVGFQSNFQIFLENSGETLANLSDYTLKITLEEEGGVGSMLHYKNAVSIEQKSSKIESPLTYFCSQKGLKMEDSAIVLSFALHHPAAVKKVTITIYLEHKDKKDIVPPITIIGDQLSLITDKMIQKALKKQFNSLADVLTKLQKYEIIDKNAVKNHTALSEAVQLGDTEIVSLLLDQSIPIDQKDNQQSTPLHYAAEAGHTEIAKLLIARLDKNQLNQQDSQSYTALHHAVYERHIEIAKLLIEKLGKDQINQQDDEGSTSLHYAAKAGEIEIAKLLIDKLDKDQVNQQDDKGRTPLYYAVKRKHIEIAKLLIDKLDKDQLNQQAFKGITPLSYAIVKHIEIAELLIEKLDKEQLNQRYKDGLTPLHFAAMSDSIKIAKLLIDKLDKEQLNQQDNEGSTSLHYAITLDHIEIAKLLIEVLSQDQLNQKDSSGATPLFYAIGKHPEIVDLLIKKLDKDQLNLEIDAGYTLLHYAAELNDIRAAKSLLAKGVDKTIKNTEGKTPRDLATTPEIKDLL